MFKKNIKRNVNMRKKVNNPSGTENNTNTSIEIENIVTTNQEEEKQSDLNTKITELKKNQRNLRDKSQQKKKVTLSFTNDEEDMEDEAIIAPSISSITAEIEDKKAKKKEKKKNMANTGMHTFNLKRNSDNSEYMHSSKGMYTSEKLQELRNGMIIYQNKPTIEDDNEVENNNGYLSEALTTVSITDDGEISMKLDGKEVLIPVEDLNGEDHDEDIIDEQKIKIAKEKRERLRNYGTDYIPMTDDDDKEDPKHKQEEDEDKESEDLDDYKGKKIKVDTNAIIASVNQKKAEKLEKKRIKQEIKNGLQDYNPDQDNDWEMEMIKKGAYFKAGQIEKENYKSKGKGNYDTSYHLLNLLDTEEHITPPFDDLIQQINDKINITKKIQEFNSKKCIDIETELQKSNFTETEQNTLAAEQKLQFFHKISEYLENYSFMMDELHPKIKEISTEMKNIFLKRFQKQRRYRRDKFMDLFQKANFANTNNSHFAFQDMDLENPTDKNEFMEEHKQLVSKADKLFDDVDETYSNLASVMKVLEDFKNNQRDIYEKAYCSMSLYDLTEPFVEHQLIYFESFLNGSTIRELPFFSAILSFIENTNPQNIPGDMDDLLISKLVDKLVLPKLEFLISEGYSPESSLLTTNAIKSLSELSEFFQLSESSPVVPLYQSVLTIIEKSVSQLTLCFFEPTSKSRLFSLQTLNKSIDLLKNCLLWHPLFLDKDKLILEKIVIEKLLYQKIRPYLLKETDPVHLLQVLENISTIVPSNLFKTHHKINFSQDLLFNLLKIQCNQNLLERSIKLCFHYNDGVQANNILKTFHL